MNNKELCPIPSLFMVELGTSTDFHQKLFYTY